MKKIFLLLLIIILSLSLFNGCSPATSPGFTPSEGEGEGEGEPTGDRVVLVELFNADGCAASAVINPIMEELAQQYGTDQVILLEEAGWGKYTTSEVQARFDWYVPGTKHTPFIAFNGLSETFSEGIVGGGGGGGYTLPPPEPEPEVELIEIASKEININEGGIIEITDPENELFGVKLIIEPITKQKGLVDEILNIVMYLGLISTCELPEHQGYLITPVVIKAGIEDMIPGISRIEIPYNEKQLINSAVPNDAEIHVLRTIDINQSWEDLSPEQYIIEDNVVTIPINWTDNYPGFYFYTLAVDNAIPPDPNTFNNPLPGDLIYKFSKLIPFKINEGWLPGHVGIYVGERYDEENEKKYNVIEALLSGVQCTYYEDISKFKGDSIYLGAREPEYGLSHKDRNKIIAFAKLAVGMPYAAFETFTSMIYSGLGKGDWVKGDGNFNCVGLAEAAYEYAGIDLVSDYDEGNQEWSAHDILTPAEQWYRTVPASGLIDQNTAPQIDYLEISQAIDLMNGHWMYTLNCTASDQDGDSLTYIWSRNEGEGTFSPDYNDNKLTVTNGKEIKWVSPSDEGEYTIFCKVIDNYGGEDTGEKVIQVGDISGNIENIAAYTITGYDPYCIQTFGVENITNRSIFIHWPKVLEAEEYKVYRSVNGVLSFNLVYYGDGISDQIIDGLDESRIGWFDFDVTPENSYSYKVSCVVNGQESIPSEVITRSVWLPECSLVSPPDYNPDDPNDHPVTESDPLLEWNPVGISSYPYQGEIDYGETEIWVVYYNTPYPNPGHAENIWGESFNNLTTSSTRFDPDVASSPLIPGDDHIYAWETRGIGCDNIGDIIAMSWSGARHFFCMEPPEIIEPPIEFIDGVTVTYHSIRSRSVTRDISNDDSVTVLYYSGNLSDVLSKGGITNAIDVSWPAYDNCTGYRVYRSKNSSEYSIILNWDTSGSISNWFGLYDPDVDMGNAYRYYVTAYNDTENWETVPSNIYTIEIDNETFLPPIYLNQPPDYGQVDNPNYLFQWTPIGNILPYGDVVDGGTWLRIFDAETLSSVWIQNFDDFITSQANYNGDTLISGNTYRWYVRSYGFDANGQIIASSESEDWEFTYTGTNTHHAPVIYGFNVEPIPPDPTINQDLTVFCDAFDEDGDTLTYNWHVTDGTITGSGATVTWTTPSIPGDYTISCTVSDGDPLTADASDSIVITVFGENIDASLIDVTSVPITLGLNVWDTVYVEVENIGNVSHQFKIQADEPTGTEFVAKTKYITLNPGVTANIDFAYKFYGAEGGNSRSLTFRVYNSSGEELDFITTNSIGVTAGADLTVMELNSPSSASAGNTISVYWKYQNIGTATAYDFYNGIYLSTNSTISSSDTLLASNGPTSIDPNVAVSQTQSVTIPSGISGTYYIGFLVDRYDNVVEANESNNYKANVININ